MRSCVRQLMLAAVAAISLSLVALAPQPASAQSEEPPSAQVPGVVPADENRSDEAAAQDCTFFSHGDYLHISTSSGPRAASGHGWWTEGTCPPTWRADVWIQLQVRRGDTGEWVDVGDRGEASALPPGSGRGNRVTGRVECQGTANIEWRSIVDVDIVGVPDSSERLNTPARTLSCWHPAAVVPPDDLTPARLTQGEAPR